LQNFLNFFLFLLETIGHAALSTGVELLATEAAAIHPAFDRYAAQESAFVILATPACFVILRSKDLNYDCFNKALIVRVSFKQAVP
jgi:hypothetical protein